MNQSEKRLWAAVFGAEYVHLRQSGCTSEAQAERAATRASEALRKLQRVCEEGTAPFHADIAQMLGNGATPRLRCRCGRTELVHGNPRGAWETIPPEREAGVEPSPPREITIRCFRCKETITVPVWREAESA